MLQVGQYGTVDVQTMIFDPAEHKAQFLKKRKFGETINNDTTPNQLRRNQTLNVLQSGQKWLPGNDQVILLLSIARVNKSRVKAILDYEFEFEDFMGSRNGLGMLEVMMKFAVFVSRLLKESHQESSIRVMNVQ